MFGYYTVSSGYRKVPGNRCEGGLDLNPVVYSCSPVSIFNFKIILSIIIVAAILYFGWPLFEAVLIALPIPDPKDVKDKVKNMLKSGENPRGGLKSKEYTKNFNQAPECLGESSDEEDSQQNKNGTSNLRYDSDEDRLADSELINLDGNSSRDRTNTAAEKIPKLRKPPQ